MKRVNLENLQTFKEYAEQEGISLDAVYKQANRGDIKTLLIGGKKFVYGLKKSK